MSTNWKNNRLDSFAQLKRGITYKGDDLVDFGGQPYINMKSFKRGGGFNPIGLKYFNGFYRESDIVTASNVLIVNTDVTDGEIIGLPLIIPDFLKDQNVLCSHHVTVLRIDSNELIPEFLFRLLCLTDYRKEFRKYSRGTTVKMLDLSGIKNILFSYPDDIKEQQIIVDILNTLDRAIAQTEALIVKHQRIKTGLMQDLLTRGIDEHGKLRNSVAHPDQFTTSDFGLFPKAWKITTLGKIIADTKGLIQTGPFGTQVHAYDYAEEGIPTMMPQYIDETGWIELEDLPRLTPAKALELRRHALKENDVIFARRGELSKCSAISKREEGWICGTDFMLVRVPSSIMSGEWFAHYYRDDIGQRQVMAQAVGSIMKGINTPLMASLIVALPSIEEQIRILAVIDSQEKIIKETIDQHNKLLKIKTGLMQDLLSGGVSVTPLLENN